MITQEDVHLEAHKRIGVPEGKPRSLKLLRKQFCKKFVSKDCDNWKIGKDGVSPASGKSMEFLIELVRRFERSAHCKLCQQHISAQTSKDAVGFLTCKILFQPQINNITCICASSFLPRPDHNMHAVLQRRKGKAGGEEKGKEDPRGGRASRTSSLSHDEAAGGEQV